MAPVQTWLPGWEWRAQLGPAGQERKDVEMTVRLWVHVEGGEEAGASLEAQTDGLSMALLLFLQPENRS